MTPLDKAFLASTKDKNKQDEFYNLFLNSDIYIPIHDGLGKESQRRAGDYETITPITIESKNIVYLIMFDSKDKLSAWAQREVGYVTVPGYAVVEMMISVFHWILNVGTEYTKVFIPNEINSLKESVAKLRGRKRSLAEGTKVLIGVPATIPRGLVDSLKDKLSRNREVQKAYLGQVHYLKEGEKPHLAIVLRMDISSHSAMDAIRKDLSIVTRGFLKDDEYVDIYFDDGGTVSSGVVRVAEPFYVRNPATCRL